MDQYWVELARHPEGHALFYSPQKQDTAKHPEWLRLKFMRPATPGRRIKRRVWLLWNREKQQLANTELADELPEIYDWLCDSLEQLAEHELEKMEEGLKQ
jgi:hypothetical protein